MEKVVVYRLDRLSRSTADFGRIWELFDAHKVEFCSVNEKFDTSSPVGRAMVNIIMVFAQLERETIAQRIKDNYYQRARRGVWMGGPAPFGFRIERTIVEGKAASTFAPDDNIATVKEIFRRYAYTNASLGKIAAWLTAEGVPGIGRKTWDNVSIARILHNPAYVRADADVYLFYKRKGLILYNEIESYTGTHGLWLWGKRDRGANKYTDMQDQLIALAQHEGVVDSETWLRCQDKLEGNRQIKNTGAGKYTWLSGKIKCGYCGYAMRVLHSRGKTYVMCSGRTNLHACDVRLENTELSAVEGSASAQIKEYLADLKTNLPDAAPAEKADNNRLKIELVGVEQQIDNLIDSLAKLSGTSVEYVNRRIEELDARRTELLTAINATRRSNTDHLPGAPFDTLGIDEKKYVADMLVDKVLKFNDRVEVIFK